jgi:hypothetical protein
MGSTLQRARRRLTLGLVVAVAAAVPSLAAVGLGVTPALAESSNYVTNAGFESPSNLSGWSTSSGVTVTSAQAHTGTQSATLTVPTNGTTTQVLNDSPNWLSSDAGVDWVKLDVWAKGEAGGVVRVGNGSGFTVATTLTSSNWTEITGVFDTALYGMGGAADFLVKYSISTADNPNATGIVYLDDASETTGSNSVTCSTNVSNCDFEYPYNLQGWNTGASGSNAALAITSADSHNGTQAGQVTWLSSTAGSAYINDSPDWLSATYLAGKTSCTATAWVKGSTSGGAVKLSQEQYVGGTNFSSASVTPNGSWQSITDVLNLTSGSDDIHIYQQSMPQNATLLTDQLSVTCS